MIREWLDDTINSTSLAKDSAARRCRNNEGLEASDSEASTFSSPSKDYLTRSLKQ